MKHRRMLTRLKALSLLAPKAVILTPVADSDVLVAHKNGTDTCQKNCLAFCASQPWSPMSTCGPNRGHGDHFGWRRNRCSFPRRSRRNQFARFRADRQECPQYKSVGRCCGASSITLPTLNVGEPSRRVKVAESLIPLPSTR
jgi:hypothetical protein